MKVCMVRTMGIDLQGFLEKFVWTLYGLKIYKLLFLLIFILRYSLPLNRGGRLSGDIVGHAGNAGDLVNNAVRDGFHQFIG